MQPSPPPKPATPPDLTARELEVLRLVANGLTNERIGARLGQSTDTVKYLLRGIRAKLGARDRAHAVAIADRVGLLTMTDVPLPPHLAPAGSAGTSRATSRSATGSGSTSGRRPR